MIELIGLTVLLLGTLTAADICNATTEDCLYGCDDGFYGSNCTERCSDIDGHCQQCILNNESTGIECKKCSWNFYPSAGRCIACNFWCLNVYDSAEPSCRHEDGRCTYGCRPGSYSPNCGKRCSHTCANICHQDTGICLDCQYPFYCGPTCELICQEGCLLQHCNQSCQCVNGCTATHWGDKCLTVCNSNCIKPSNSSYRVCNASDGTCLFGCNDGRFWGHLCDESCSKNCVNATCEQDTGNCTEGCSSRTVYGWRCNENCHKNCLGGTCERANGYCDEGCRVGTFGIKCNFNCSENCKGTKCNRQSGYCENGCKDGRYGNNCENTCSLTCSNQRCDIIDGGCTDGCVPGFEGHQCKTETESLVKSLLGLAISGWSLLVILLAFVIIKALRRRLIKSKENNTEQTMYENSSL